MISYMVGKLAPNSTHSTRGLGKYVPGSGYFRAVPSQNGENIVTSPPTSIVHSGDEVRQRVHDVFVHLEARVGYVYKGRKEDVEQEECKYAPFVKSLFHCGVPTASDILGDHTYPLHRAAAPNGVSCKRPGTVPTTVGVEKDRLIKHWSMVKPEKAAPVTGTALRNTGPV